MVTTASHRSRASTERLLRAREHIQSCPPSPCLLHIPNRCTATQSCHLPLAAMWNLFPSAEAQHQMVLAHCQHPCHFKKLYGFFMTPITGAQHHHSVLIGLDLHPSTQYKHIPLDLLKLFRTAHSLLHLSTMCLYSSCFYAGFLRVISAKKEHVPFWCVGKYYLYSHILVRKIIWTNFFHTSINNLAYHVYFYTRHFFKSHINLERGLETWLAWSLK